MSDQLADSSRFRVFTVIDIYTRECLRLWLAGSSEDRMW